MHGSPDPGAGGDHGQSLKRLDSADAVGRWVVDVERNIVTADALVAFLFGFTPTQVDGGVTLEAFNGGVHPDDRAYAMESVRRCVREGGWFIVEHRVRSADGRTRRILARGRFDRNDIGMVSSGSGIVVDITNSREDGDPTRGFGAGGTVGLLEQATDLILESHDLLDRTGERQAIALAEALLLELGRSIARLQTSGLPERLH